jgi:hypothetical protein
MSKEKTQELRESIQRLLAQFIYIQNNGCYTEEDCYLEVDSMIENNLLSPQWIPAEQVPEEDVEVFVSYRDEYNKIGYDKAFFDGIYFYDVNRIDLYELRYRCTVTHYQIITEPINK